MQTKILILCLLLSGMLIPARAAPIILPNQPINTCNTNSGLTCLLGEFDANGAPSEISALVALPQGVTVANGIAWLCDFGTTCDMPNLLATPSILSDALVFSNSNTNLGSTVQLRSGQAALTLFNASSRTGTYGYFTEDQVGNGLYHPADNRWYYVSSPEDVPEPGTFFLAVIGLCVLYTRRCKSPTVAA